MPSRDVDDEYDDDRPRRRRRDDDDYDDEDDDDRPRRRRRSEFDDAAALVVPGGSPLAIISCYAGLIGFCLPLVGLVFAVPALVCGVIALRRSKKWDSYGGATSNLRAIIGVVLSSLGILMSLGFGVALLFAK